MRVRREPCSHLSSLVAGVAIGRVYPQEIKLGMFLTMMFMDRGHTLQLHLTLSTLDSF